MIFTFCKFNNLRIGSSFINYLTNGTFLNFIQIEESLFYDILCINEAKDNSLINFFDIQGKLINILINNCKFSFLSSFLNLYFVKNLEGNFSLISSVFDQNQIFQEIIYLFGLFDLIINSSNFLYTNNQNGSLFYFGGGNLFLINCMNKQIENLEIKFAFSSQTAFGIKIVDNFDNEPLAILKNRKVYLLLVL